MRQGKFSQLIAYGGRERGWYDCGLAVATSRNCPHTLTRRWNDTDRYIPRFHGNPTVIHVQLRRTRQTVPLDTQNTFVALSQRESRGAFCLLCQSRLDHTDYRRPQTCGNSGLLVASPGALPPDPRILEAWLGKRVAWERNVRPLVVGLIRRVFQAFHRLSDVLRYRGRTRRPDSAPSFGA